MLVVNSKWELLRSQVGPAIVREVKDALLARWPDAFTNPPRPLMVGIHNDIKMNHPREAIFVAMHDWTNQREYLKALIAGGSRYDLYGVPNGIVLERDRVHAMKILRRQT